MSGWATILWAAFWLELCLRLALVARILARRSPAPRSIAWILLLLSVSVIGPLAYFMIGESRLGTRRATRHSRLETQIEALSAAMWKGRGSVWEAREGPYRAMSRLGMGVGGLPPMRGNDLELLSDAAAMLERLVADIDAARKHVHVVTYIWHPRGRSMLVAEAMMRAAQRGVQCRVLVDYVGGKTFWRSELPERMRAAGVRVVATLPVNPLRFLLARIDLRNHRKIAVVDGVVGYCGSQNITDERVRIRGRRLRFLRRRWATWLDLTVRIHGPAVQILQTTFLSDWALDADEELPLDETTLPDSGAPGPSPVHVIPSGPGPRPLAIHQALLGMLFTAEKEIILTTPYFVPDEAMRAALMNAALRGVEVTITVPDVLDQPLVAAASRAYFEELLDRGVRIVLHTDGLLHAKAFCIDRTLAVVGSTNFDTRSFMLNFEITTFVYDGYFAELLRDQQMRYIQQGVAIDPAAWRARPLLQRVRDNAAQLLSPLL